MSSPIRHALFAALSLVGLAAPGSAQTFTNDFDHIVGATAFNLLTPHLEWGPSLELDGADYFGGVILRDFLWDELATSGENVLASCDTCFIGNPGEYFLPGFVRISFHEPRDQVDFDAINGNAYPPEGGELLARAFDGDGQLIDSDTVALPALRSGESYAGHLRLRAPGIHTVLLSSLLPEGHTFAMDTVVHRTYESMISDLGQALPGTDGTPALTLFGSLEAGEPVDLALVGAAPGALAVPVLGASQIAAAFKQGVLVPAPDVLLPALPVGADGTAQLSAPFPAGVPVGFTLYLQLWIPDVGGPAGFAASNAVAATTPPS